MARVIVRAGVIGAGTAGAATAILLARAGCAVHVFERVAEPKPIGAGIVVQPTGQHALARLGLLDEIAAKGARLDRLWCRTPRGRTLVDLQYAQCDARWFGLGVHRGVLFDALFRAVRAEPNATVTLGREICALRRDGDAIFAIDRDAGEHGPFDLLVVADGAVSELRDAAGTTTRDAPYPWGALWFVAEDRDEIYTRELYQVAVRARRLYGALPTGLGPDGRRVVSLFWSLRADAVEAWRTEGLDAWKHELASLDLRVVPLLDQIRDASQVVFARYRDVRMRRWCDRGVVFVGDAAHATSPQLGQGANLALLDALALADAVAAASSIEGALRTYTDARRRHLRHYQRMTRWLTPFFQSSSRTLGWLRDWVFPVGNAIPPLRRHMIRTMAGVSRGLLSQPIALGSYGAEGT